MEGVCASAPVSIKKYDSTLPQVCFSSLSNVHVTFPAVVFLVEWLLPWLVPQRGFHAPAVKRKEKVWHLAVALQGHHNSIS